MKALRIFGINEINKSIVSRQQGVHLVNLNEFYCDGTVGLPMDECIARWESEREDADWDDLPDLLIP